MQATFKLLNNYFWKTIYGPVVAFIFPTLLLAILGNIMRIEYVLPGIVAMTSLFIAVQAMPLGLMEMKNSTLFKYIGSTPVNPKWFIISTILYYVLINFIALILLTIMGAFIFYNRVFLAASGEGLYSGLATPWGMTSFIFANLIHIIFSLIIGISIAVFTKTPQQALTISIIIIIPSMFLSGMIVTVDVIAQSNAMQWISRLIPFRYSTGNIIVSMTPANQIGNIMDLIGLDEKKIVFNIIGQQVADNKIEIFNSSQGNSGLIMTKSGREFIPFSDFTKEVSGLRRTEGIHIINQSVFDKIQKRHHFYSVENILNHRLALKTAFLHHPTPLNASHLRNFDFNYFRSGDSTLFTNIFMKEGALTSADNNIFRWDKSFGVRKIPELDKITEFMKIFFRGSGKDKNGGNPSRFIYIWDEFIKKNRYNFIKLFTNQNAILYTISERVLNVLLPITFSGILAIKSAKNFEWSAR